MLNTTLNLIKKLKWDIQKNTGAEERSDLREEEIEEKIKRNNHFSVLSIHPPPNTLTPSLSFL